MTPTASCDHCGKSTPLASLRQVQRAGGCRLWVCPSCEPAGTVDVAVVEVLRDVAATCTSTGTARPTEQRPGVRWATTEKVC